MHDMKDGGWVLDASVHLLSRAVMNQSAAATCSVLPRVINSVIGVKCEYCVCGIFCEYRVYMKQIDGFQHQLVY
jgi:hypothetical protein